MAKHLMNSLINQPDQSAMPCRIPTDGEQTASSGQQSAMSRVPAQEQQSVLEAAVIFLDAVVTQVSAAHLQAGAAWNEGILRELEALLQEVRLSTLLLSILALLRKLSCYYRCIWLGHQHEEDAIWMPLSTLCCTRIHLLPQSYGAIKVNVCCRCWQQSYRILSWQPGTAEGWRRLRGALLRFQTSCRSSSRRSYTSFY